MKKQKLLNLRNLGLVATGIMLGTLVSAHAEETPSEKVTSEMHEGKVTAKKHTRKAKKKMRDATGHGSTTEDMKDKAKNMGDSIDSSATKMKDKID